MSEIEAPEQGLVSPEKQSIMHGLEGIYVGVGPTDESDVGYGEMELTIEGQIVKYRRATGLGIEEDEIAVSKLRELRTEEIQELREDPLVVTNVRGFQLDEERRLLIVDDPDEGRLLVIFGGFEDILGMTLLYGPELVKNGVHEEAFSALEKEHAQAGAVPRLSNGGRAPKHTT